MWGLGHWRRGDPAYEGRESASARAMRRAGTGVVLLGLAILVRSVMGVLSAGADERVIWPHGLGAQVGVEGPGAGHIRAADQRGDRVSGTHDPAGLRHVAADQPVPLARPPGLSLRVRHPQAERRAFARRDCV